MGEASVMRMRGIGNGTRAGVMGCFSLARWLVRGWGALDVIDHKHVDRVRAFLQREA